MFPLIESPRIRHADPPREAEVTVEAITASWCVRGQPVTPGSRYTVPASIAAELERRGKARRI